MPVQARLVVAGMSAPAAQASVGTAVDQLTATGTVQGNAAPLGADNNRFTTVGAGTGCIVPPLNPGDSINVFNAGANALLIYPPVGAKINGLATNAGYSLAIATPYCEVTCITPLQYHAFQSA